MSRRRLESRPGYQEARDNDVVRALRDLRERTGQDGVILLNIGGGRVGITVAARHDELGRVLQRVADKILTDFDDGRYDGALTDA